VGLAATGTCTGVTWHNPTMILTGYADFWFTDVPLPERVERFASLGIRQLNVWSWRSKGAQLDAFADACRAHDVVFGDTFDEAAGSLTDAADLPLTLDAWDESLARAQAWGVRHLFMFSEHINADGWVKRPARDMTPMQKYANLLDGAARVMERVEKTGITVWFEALNTWHLQGGVTVCTHELAADVVRRLQHPQLRLAFDCYHQQRTAGNLIQGLYDFHGLYDSVHIGDVPTRQEPGTGEINFHSIARVLRDLKFDGILSLEFSPSRDEASALAAVCETFGL
jgi:hydroxypyruvate isomerase